MTLQNLLPNDFELKDVLDLLKKDIFLNFNCHHIAKVQAFNPATQTTTVTLNYTQEYLTRDALGNYVNTAKSYPLLVECPTIFLGGSGGSVTVPVLPGDDCIVMFNDRDINNWFAGNSSKPPASARLHSFADGIVLVGLYALNGLIPSFDTDGITLRNKTGTTKIKLLSNGTKVIITVGPLLTFELDATGQVKITNPAGELIQTLFSLASALPASTVLGVPVVPPPTYATDLAILGTFV